MRNSSHSSPTISSHTACCRFSKRTNLRCEKKDTPMLSTQAPKKAIEAINQKNDTSLLTEILSAESHSTIEITNSTIDKIKNAFLIVAAKFPAYSRPSRSNCASYRLSRVCLTGSPAVSKDISLYLPQLFRTSRNNIKSM